MNTVATTEEKDFWRVARRLHSIYAELDTTFELDAALCPDLEDSVDRADPEVMERVRNWFDEMDNHIQVWQLRQLLQSTSLQNEENLRYLIIRHRERVHKSEADKEKLDFLLVQYFAHCAPQGIAEQQLTLDEVAGVLEPVLGGRPERYPDWAPGLDDKLQRLNGCNSLEDLQNSGALLEVRELKLAVGDQYFQPALLVAFTRFNFRARRAFFKAMHLDLHAIREAVNQLEQMGCSSIDCREAGLTENESLDQVRHVVHQWKTPFRAPYSGGSSFLQLILLRHILQNALSQPQGARAAEVAQRFRPAPAPVSPLTAGTEQPEPDAVPVDEVNHNSAAAAEVRSTHTDPLLMGAADQPVAIKGDDIRVSEPAAESQAAGDSSEGEEYLKHCVADIAEQLSSVPARSTPAVSAITLGGCKLLIATWEADAFVNADSDQSWALQRTVAARTILHVCIDRHRKGEPTDLNLAVDLARKQIAEMEKQVISAKESNNIDAAVNLAATAKRLLSLIDEGKKLLA